MRVATRRMRSALGLFGPYLTGALVTSVNDQLRHAGRLLGDVRDMDVALERAQAFVDGLPDGEKVDLEPLLRRWRAQRERYRRRMLRYLDGRTYARFVQTMRDLLDALVTADGWASEEKAVSQVAPRFLYVAWRVVSAYDAVLQNAPIELLHALRIDSKRLRYGLEFMSDVLPQSVVALIPEVVALQDHLGEMHDAAVAVEMIDATLEGHTSRRYAGLRAYRQACEDEMNHRLETFPELWRRFSRPRVRETFRALARSSGSRSS
jgi:CHAD domain-containing protein